MTTLPPTRRTITIRANRDTLVLLACTVTLTLALSYSVQRRDAAPSPEPAPQDWVGRLAEVVPAAPSAFASISNRFSTASTSTTPRRCSSSAPSCAR